MLHPNIDPQETGCQDHPVTRKQTNSVAMLDLDRKSADREKPGIISPASSCELMLVFEYEYWTQLLNDDAPLNNGTSALRAAGYFPRGDVRGCLDFLYPFFAVCGFY